MPINDTSFTYQTNHYSWFLDFYIKEGYVFVKRSYKIIYPPTFRLEIINRDWKEMIEAVEKIKIK